MQLVSREFATRYLEQVGVRPSKATLDLVNRNVPLSEAHIKTTLRVRACLCGTFSSCIKTWKRCAGHAFSLAVTDQTGLSGCAQFFLPADCSTTCCVLRHGPEVGWRVTDSTNTSTHLVQAKGHVEDELHITVPPVNHSYKVPVFINPAAVLQLGIGNKVLGAAADEVRAAWPSGPCMICTECRYLLLIASHHGRAGERRGHPSRG